MTTPVSCIRNFCIIAHVDHGKSTLADRMLEITDTVDPRKRRDQMLDSMDLERERGITIKSHPVTMRYKARDGQCYQFNLIDTPGHVDFSYEVSRSMAACEGAILVVDAGQGVEAQTVANTHLVMARNLAIIPVVNKIDLPNANPSAVARQMEDILAVSREETLFVSAKTGEGVETLMEAIVRRIPPPAENEDPEKGPRALIFDSVFDTFRGVVVHLRMFEGALKPGDRALFMATGIETEIKEVGIFTPEPMPVEALLQGRVGYLIGTIRAPSDVRIGDTVTSATRPAAKALPGFRETRPVVFSGFYPASADELEKFKQNLVKLSLNDSAFTYQPEDSAALGFGFRCGFLGILHMEIVQERLRREFDVEVITTHPSVRYRVYPKNGGELGIDNPTKLPDPTKIARIEEPMIRAFVICPNACIGDIMKLTMDRRGEVLRTDSLDASRVMLTCMLPLNEVVTDFHDNLKSVSRGYASMDYEHAGYRESDIVKLDILVNGEPVDALSVLVHRSKAAYKGRQICKTLKETLPQHLFSIVIQAAIGRTVLARETLRARTKDVTAHLYGGDITRKMKLREKQKSGKKKMRMFGKVTIPQESFISVLKSI